MNTELLANMKKEIEDITIEISNINKSINALKINDQRRLDANAAIPPGIACKVAFDKNGLIIKGIGLEVSDIPKLDIENINNLIEKSIYDTNISMKDIQEFIQIQLNSGIWSLRAFKQLADKGNPFACYEMASMEYNGIITGKPRYDKAYQYYMTAAKFNHPVATWAIGYLYYNGNVGTKSKRDLMLAVKYFNKARKLKCSNASLIKRLTSFVS